MTNLPMMLQNGIYADCLLTKHFNADMLPVRYIYFHELTKEDLNELKTNFPDFYDKLVIKLAEKLL
jgi:hypothetical protein